MKRVYLSPICLFLIILCYGQVDFQSSNLPIFIIDTEGQEIVDEPKIFSTMKIIDNGPDEINNISDSANGYDGYVGIELRGQTSQQLFDKKSYGLELRSAENEDINAEILGFPEEGDWILYGPYSDKSLIRNFLTFYLWSQTDRYGSRVRLCELVINDDYKGVYVFMEKIKRDDNRVDINKLNDDENEGDDLTGGYILKLDKTNPGEVIKGWNSPYSPPGRQGEQVINFLIEDPDPEDITETQLAYIEAFVTGFEETLKSEEFDDPENGYHQFIDLESFVDYALLCEANRNVDSYRLSTYLYKDKDSNGGKLVMGPPWDYNLAFGNANYCEGGSTEGWAWDFNSVCGGDYWLNPFWWDRFLADATYVNRFKTRWTELRSGPFATATVHQFIDSIATILEQPQQRNFTRWPVLGQHVWPNSYVGATYEDEIDYLKTWIEDRFNWMDGEISNMEVLVLSSPPEDLIFKIYPNPTTDELSIESTREIKSFAVLGLSGILLETTGINDSTITFDISTLPAGIYVLKVALGDGEVRTRLISKQ